MKSKQNPIKVCERQTLEMKLLPFIFLMASGTKKGKKKGKKKSIEMNAENPAAAEMPGQPLIVPKPNNCRYEGNFKWVDGYIMSNPAKCILNVGCKSITDCVFLCRNSLNCNALTFAPNDNKCYLLDQAVAETDMETTMRWWDYPEAFTGTLAQVCN